MERRRRFAAAEVQALPRFQVDAAWLNQEASLHHYSVHLRQRCPQATTIENKAQPPWTKNPNLQSQSRLK